MTFEVFHSLDLLIILLILPFQKDIVYKICGPGVQIRARLK